MSQFEFNLATQEDDAALRKLLAATPMQGDIQLAFAREPSYFAASAVDGQYVQVVAVRDKQSKNIIGMGSRAISNCYVNGQVTSVGYLSALRLLPEYRGKTAMLAKGYQFFRELHNDRKAAFYLTTIAADNQRAVDLLTSRRAGLPVYHPLGRYHTLTLSSRSRRNFESDIMVKKATLKEGQQILEFLNEEGPKRQFFPSYNAHEFFESPHRLLGLKPDSFLLARRDNRLVGTLGVWDQRAFKQNLVCGYSKRLRWTRPLYNGIAGLRAKPKLPDIGESLNLRYAAVPVVANNDPDVARSLIFSALADLHEQGGDFLAIGLHEDDPLLPIAKPYSGREYITLSYLVYWPDETPSIDQWADRVPYLELGCL